MLELTGWFRQCNAISNKLAISLKYITPSFHMRFSDKRLYSTDVLRNTIFTADKDIMRIKYNSEDWQLPLKMQQCNRLGIF